MPDRFRKPLGLAITTENGATEGSADDLGETVLGEFVSKLSKLAPTNEPIPPTRKNIIRLLDTLTELLEPVISTQIGSLDDGTTLVTHHPTIQLLIDTSDLLRDLDNGLCEPLCGPDDAEHRHECPNLHAKLNHDKICHRLYFKHRSRDAGIGHCHSNDLYGS
jgi:hypothetical protein